MNWEDFKITNWDTMTDAEQTAWLAKFVLCEDVQFDGTKFTLFGSDLSDQFGQTLVSNCEKKLQDSVRELYLDNCLAEASSITYKGMTQEQVQSPDTAKKFYATLLMLPSEVRARCMYWAVRGERA